MAEKLRVDVELWRLGICLLDPHSHLSLPPPVSGAAGEILQTVCSSENKNCQ